MPERLPAILTFTIPRANTNPLSAVVTIYDPIAQSQEHEKEMREGTVRLLKFTGAIALLFGTLVPAAAAFGNALRRVENGGSFWGPLWS